MYTLLILLQNAYGVNSPENEVSTSHYVKRGLKKVIPNSVEISIKYCNSKTGGDIFFKSDLEYVSKQLDELKPDYILACGNDARIILQIIKNTIPTIYMPHPAYRALSKERTAEIKLELEDLINGN